MNIIYHHRVASRDGQYVHICEIVDCLRSLGHNILLVGPAGIEQPTFGHDNRIIYHMKRLVPKAAYEICELLYSAFSFLRLWALCYKFQPDAIYERYNLYAPAGALVARYLQIPFLLEVNAPLAQERARYGGLALPELAQKIENFTWRAADHVVAVTDALAAVVVAAGVAAERVQVIPNGVNPARFASLPAREAAKAALGLSGRRVIGFVGFVREWHGLENLVEWLARSAPADVVLWLAGDGPARQQLQLQAAQLGISSRVRIAGVVLPDELPKHLAAFDVAVQPEAVFYSSPLKIFEYMAAGCAIVAPDQANIREILANEHNALLVSRADFGSAILRLLDDPQLCFRLGNAAKTSIARRGLIWERNAKRIVELIRRSSLQRTSVGRAVAGKTI